MNLRNTFINGIRNFFISNMPKVGKFAHFDETSVLTPPATISGRSNIYVANNCNIASGSTLFATNAKITIKEYFVAAKGLTIITGSHERRVGRFCASITEREKNHEIGLDNDVIINEDVWAGINVTVMPGVEIGRGTTIAASAVVTASMPPYCICAGVPARFIKFYWTIDQILEHESILYPSEERYTREELEQIFEKYQK